jgi:hypothetical protein
VNPYLQPSEETHRQRCKHSQLIFFKKGVKQS